MDTPRIASSDAQHGLQVARHKQAQDAPEGLGAFFAVLSGLDDAAVQALPAPLATSSDARADEVGAVRSHHQAAQRDGNVLAWAPPSQAQGPGVFPQGTQESATHAVPTLATQARMETVGSRSHPMQAERSRAAVVSADTEPGPSSAHARRSGPVAGPADHAGAPRDAAPSAPAGIDSAPVASHRPASAPTSAATFSTAATAAPGHAAAVGPAVERPELFAQTPQSLLAQRGAAGGAGAGAHLAEISADAHDPWRSASRLVAQTARMDSGAGVGGPETGMPSSKPHLPPRRPGAALPPGSTQAVAQSTERVQRQAAHDATGGKPGSVKQAGFGGEVPPLPQKLEVGLERVGEPIAAQAVPAAVLPGNPWLAERRAEGAASLPERRVGPVGAGVQAFVDGSRLTEPPGSVPLEGAALAPEDAITEQVTYWLSENLKNAELTVDHAGQPIEVRVSLTGNEAHVAFRSDQAQTRSLLDASVEQLRELLRSEGLVLSGMSVDTQADGQRGQPDGDPSPPHAASEAAPSKDGEPLAPARRILTDRSVDLFV